MLQKEDITGIAAGTPEWYAFRLGRFTSSEIYKILSPKGIDKNGLSYIYQKVGETITGISDEKEVGFVEQLAHGIATESDALTYICQTLKLEFIISQVCIGGSDKRFCSTPDGIIVLVGDREKDYAVETIEVKCPIKYSNYIKQRMCSSPSELKSAFPQYYWQVIDQMDNCGASVGYFYTYHESFKDKLHGITFKKVPLWDEFRFIKDRKAEAIDIYNKTLDKMLK